MPWDENVFEADCKYFILACTEIVYKCYIVVNVCSRCS